VPTHPKPFCNKTKIRIQRVDNINDTVQLPEQLEKKNTSHATKGVETSLPDPLILYHFDTPVITLVNNPVNGRNYGKWSCSMHLSLNAKNKLDLIDKIVKSAAAG
jgi:hypothetical protein